MTDNFNQSSNGENGTQFNHVDPLEPGILDKHPILERDYTIITPMLLKTVEIVQTRIRRRRSGIVFYAPPRLGKTKCAATIEEFFRDPGQHSLVILVSARRSKSQSESHMWRQILEAERHALAGRLDKEHLRATTYSHIVSKLSQLSSRHFILIIDEMQLLNNTDFEQLQFLHNELDRRKIRMTLVGFAQPEIMHKRSAMIATNNGQLITRFLSEMISFEGCCDVTALLDILIFYDDLSEYPIGSGRSFTNALAPRAYASGFRLASYAHRVWTELTNAARISSGGLPMEHIAMAIEELLLNISGRDVPGFELSAEDIVNAVTATNLANYLGVTNSDHVANNESKNNNE